MPQAERADEADRRGVGPAEPGAPGRRVERAHVGQRVDVDAVRIDQHVVGIDAVGHQLVLEHLRDDDDQRGVVHVAALERAEGLGERDVAGAPLALGPDLRAVELQDERDPQAAGKLEARERAERVALVDRVGPRVDGGRSAHLLVGVVDERGPVHELEDPPRRHLGDRRAVDPVGALGREDVYRDPRVHEAVDHAGGVRGRPSDVSAEVAQRRFAAQVGDRADRPAGRRGRS